jgi:hypothetical protein
VAHPVAIKAGRAGDGILARDATIIRALLPIRDAVREVLRAQAANQPWTEAQVRLRIATATSCTASDRSTTPSSRSERAGDRRGTGNPSPPEPGALRRRSPSKRPRPHGADLRERVIAPPSAPLIATAADALAVTLNATGRVDVDHLAELLDRDPATALAQLGEAVFRNPSTEAGRRTTPICRGPFAPSWRSPKRRPNRTCSMRATSRRCGWCSPRTSGRRTSPRSWARPGFWPPTSRRSPWTSRARQRGCGTPPRTRPGRRGSTIVFA